MLISGRGRSDEEEWAYRSAMSCDDLVTASRAAVSLGELLEVLRDDLEGAQACFEFAREHGTGDTAQKARVHLAVVLAYQGNREAAEKELRFYIDTRYAEEDGDVWHARIAKGVVAAAQVRGTRLLLRKVRMISFHLNRRRHAVRVALMGGRS
jgi:hypothetical protein